MTAGWKTLLPVVLAVLVNGAGAATVYVTSELQFGLHADRLTTSPILKLVPSGTPLELIETEDQASFVRMADGTEGWLDNSYVVNESAAATGLAGTEADQGLAGQDAATLEQQLKSERVKSGELQVQIAELRKRIGQDGSNDTLYEKIDQLAMEKKQLEVQLAQILEGDGPPAPALSANPDPGGLYNLRNMAISLVVALVAGVIAGLYLMDFLYRRRHGGFRV